MDPLHIFFAATGVIFWVLLFVSSIGIIASIENDSPGWATTTVGLTFGVLYFFSDFSLRYTWHFDWRLLATYIIGYLVVGVLWSILKWYLNLSARRERWDDAVADYRKQNQIDKKTVVSKNDAAFVLFMTARYTEFVVNPYKTSRIIRPDTEGKSYIEPMPEPNKPRIILWMVYWPWSMLWSLFDDVITGLFKQLYRWLKGVYEGMARWMFADVV